MLKIPIMIMIVIGFEAPKFVLTKTTLYIKHIFQNAVRFWPLVKVASYLIVFFDSYVDHILSFSMLLRF